jgi:hypothetical protein
VTVSEISAKFGLSLGETITKVTRLVEAGELIDHGGDQITAAPRKWDRERAEAPPKQKQIWTVAVYTDRKGSWTAATIARLAEANRDYVKDYLAWLADQGHLRITRRKGKENLYRLHPDAPPAGKAPAWVNRRNRKLRAKTKGEKA